MTTNSNKNQIKNDFNLYINSNKASLIEIKDNMWEVLIKKSDILKITKINRKSLNTFLSRKKPKIIIRDKQIYIEIKVIIKYISSYYNKKI